MCCLGPGLPVIVFPGPGFGVSSFRPVPWRPVLACLVALYSFPWGFMPLRTLGPLCARFGALSVLFAGRKWPGGGSSLLQVLCLPGLPPAAGASLLASRKWALLPLPFSLLCLIGLWSPLPVAGALIALPCRSCFPAVGRDPGRPAAGSPFLYGVIYAIYFRGDLPPGLPLPLGNRFGRSFAPGLIPLPVPSLPLGRIAFYLPRVGSHCMSKRPGVKPGPVAIVFKTFNNF